MGKTKACENKLRQLQAPAPEKKDDTKVDDCTKAKKNLAGEQLVLKALEAAAKDCTCEKPKPQPEDCDEVGKELCKIDHELVALYNSKFGLRRLVAQKRCPTRRQLQQVAALSLNKDDETDKKILALLETRKIVMAKKETCVQKKERNLRIIKKMEQL